MVFTGQPSKGCLNCRRAKKRCDEAMPSCGRCIRLGRACGGYRDFNELMFRDQNARVSRRASGTSDASVSGPGSESITRNPSPEKDSVARTFFFTHFVTPVFLPYLKDVTLEDEELLMEPILACGLAGLSNRGMNERGHEEARRHYVQAITATNAALRHPRRMKNDNTLIAVALLALFERLTWETSDASKESWEQHIHGSAQVMKLRGGAQIRNPTGLSMFRDLRSTILFEALCNERPMPADIIQWTRSLGYDEIHTPADQLTLFGARLADIRSSFRSNSQTPEELSTLSSALEHDLIQWSEDILAGGGPRSFTKINDIDSTLAWNGIRHEYGSSQAHRHWNLWRCLRILLVRTQETIWRQSTATVSDKSQTPPTREHFSAIRDCMAADICSAVAGIFQDQSLEPPVGSIATGYLQIMPLLLAGSCLLQNLTEPTISPGGGRIILVDKALHLDPYNDISLQLAWIIDRLNYISRNVGIGWAGAASSFLKGEQKVYYDLGRSRILQWKSGIYGSHSGFQPFG